MQLAYSNEHDAFNEAYDEMLLSSFYFDAAHQTEQAIMAIDRDLDLLTVAPVEVLRKHAPTLLGIITKTAQVVGRVAE